MKKSEIKKNQIFLIVIILLTILPGLVACASPNAPVGQLTTSEVLPTPGSTLQATQTTTMIAPKSTSSVTPSEVPPTSVPSMTPTEISYEIEPLKLKSESQLIDTRINSLVSGCIRNPTSDWSDWIKGLKYDGFTRTRFTLDFVDGPAVDLKYASIETAFPADYVDLYKQMKDIGIKTRYSLSFWDMAYRQNGGAIGYNRLSNEAETDKYLAYVKMTVTSLKGLVDSYELWNEPDANYEFHQRIKPEDYIRVAKLAIPLIRGIDPQARIVIPATSSYIQKDVQDYSMRILKSSVVALADAISLHTVNNDASPVFHPDYYYGYDSMWKNIKATAEANGFHGEYVADELNYRSDYSLNKLQPEPGGDYHPYAPEIAAKYIGRMIAINLGLNVSIGTSGTNAVERPFEGKMIRNMAYLLDGLQSSPLPIQVQSGAKHIRYYTFKDNKGNYYIAIWDDGEAKVVSQDIPFSLIVETLRVKSVLAMDPFNSTMQEVKFTASNNDVNLDGLNLKDYLVIYKLEIR